MSRNPSEALSSPFDSPEPIGPGAGPKLTTPALDAPPTPRPQPAPAAATAASATLTCPACGFEQPPAEECLKCGLVVSKYRPREMPPPPAPGVRSSDEIASDLAEQGYEPRERVSDQVEEDNSFFAPEKKGLAKGMVGGAVMMAIAVAWFGLGWAAGYIFFYPPVLFVIGLFGFLKGLFTGNVAGA